jgi:hypothetical protein
MKDANTITIIVVAAFAFLFVLLLILKNKSDRKKEFKSKDINPVDESRHDRHRRRNSL